MLTQLLALEGYVFFLVFVRVGAAFSIMPGIGEAYITVRIRLLIVLVMTVVIAPVVGPTLPPIPDAPAAVVLLIAAEVLFGLFIGTVARIAVAVLVTTGTVIAFLTGFANAVLFNPMIQDQGVLPSIFLLLLGTVLIFITDLHHLLIRAVVDSYTLFTPGSAPPFDDFAETIARLVAGSFDVGVRLATPFVIVAMLFYIALGLLARLMPQFQVFFIGLPVQLMLGLLMLVVTVGAVMIGFLEYFTTTVSGFLAPR